MTQPVLFKELSAKNGFKVGVATLNAEKSLNALNLEMVGLLHTQLVKWQADKEIALVLLEGAGEKAFCAGGDVVQLYKAAKEAGDGNVAADVETFFSQEYQLDHLIHVYEKPILLWGHGIVMGGGLGLLAGASHRVVTEKSRIAMPEITIGLYPDVGGSYFLNKMPNAAGLFLGLTGASINATDAKYVKLADYFVSHESKSLVVEKLLAESWHSESKDNHTLLSELLNQFESKSITEAPEGNVARFDSFMVELGKQSTIEDAFNLILNVETDDKWFSKAKASLAHGSPLSAQIIFRQMALGVDMSLADVFRMELGMSVQCAAIGDFPEGVRALLIDKDNAPNWKYKNVSEVDGQVLDSVFKPLWDVQTHPLKDL